MGKFIHFAHWMNIIFQSIFSLLFPVALALGGGYLLVEYTGVGTWVYAVLIILGVFSGLVSMVRFILLATKQINALEDAAREQSKKQK